MTITNKNLFIGQRIKEYRMKKKWTQEELGNRVSMKKAAISTYEVGRVEIPRSKLEAIARVLEIKMTDLLPVEDVVSQDSINEHINEAKAKLNSDQLAFLELLLAKMNSLDEEGRENFLKNVKFAVEFFNKQ